MSKVISHQDLLESLSWRYAVKRFDEQKKISKELWSALEASLVLTPSSYGLQPWKFLVITNPEIKAQLREVSWKQSQVTDCSHHVVFAVREKMSEDNVEEFIQSIAQTRGVALETLAGYKKMMISDVVKGPRSAMAFEWAARQAYIALGNFMTSAALLGVDTCPLEGIDPQAYDRILGLEGSGFKTVVACPAGYRSSEDAYAKVKKVRFSHEKMIQYYS